MSRFTTRFTPAWVLGGLSVLMLTQPSQADEPGIASTRSVMQQLDGRTGLVHVLDEMRTAPLAFLPALSGVLVEPPGARRAAAEAAVKRLARRHGIAADAALIWPGVPAEVLTAATSRLKANVLVMGAVSRSGLSNAFIGSTAEAVIDRVASGKELARVATQRRVVHGVVVSPDDKYAFISVEGVGSEPGTLEVVDLTTRARVASVDLGQMAGGVDFWKTETH